MNSVIPLGILLHIHCRLLILGLDNEPSHLPFLHLVSRSYLPSPILTSHLPSLPLNSGDLPLIFFLSDRGRDRWASHWVQLYVISSTRTMFGINLIIIRHHPWLSLLFRRRRHRPCLRVLLRVRWWTLLLSLPSSSAFLIWRWSITAYQIRQHSRVVFILEHKPQADSSWMLNTS